MESLDRALQNNAEFNFGRFVDDDGSIRPARDTGYRATKHSEPTVGIRTPRLTSIPPLEIHNSDIVDLGDKSKFGVRTIAIDWTKVSERRRADTRSRRRG
jgi:hypothetical protein